MPVPKIDRGYKISIEVEVLSAWADGMAIFSLFGHPDLTTILGNSPQIVGIIRANPRRRRVTGRMHEVGAQCFEGWHRSN
jgi:hypothetical protein